jgi:hypothetical protein
LLRAAREAHEAGIPTVINASVGTPAVDGAPPPTMQEAVRFIATAYPIRTFRRVFDADGFAVWSGTSFAAPHLRGYGGARSSC